MAAYLEQDAIGRWVAVGPKQVCGAVWLDSNGDSVRQSWEMPLCRS